MVKFFTIFLSFFWLYPIQAAEEEVLQEDPPFKSIQFHHENDHQYEVTDTSLSYPDRYRIRRLTAEVILQELESLENSSFKEVWFCLKHYELEIRSIEMLFSFSEETIQLDPTWVQNSMFWNRVHLMRRVLKKFITGRENSQEHEGGLEEFKSLLEGIESVLFIQHKTSDFFKFPSDPYPEGCNFSDAYTERHVLSVVHISSPLRFKKHPEWFPKQQNKK